MVLVYVLKEKDNQLKTTLNKPLEEEKIFSKFDVNGYAGNFDGRTYEHPQDLLSAIEFHNNSQRLGEKMRNMNM